MNTKEAFIEYLQKINKAQPEVISLFDKYYNLLIEENQKINLFSRKMLSEEIWTIHFMDSLALAEVYEDIKNERILDFGSGGGLPGIPLKIIFPENEFVFLDSIHKKVQSIKNFCKMLDLKSTDFVCSRIEDINRVHNASFDRIVCRSVRILPEFKDHLLRLLKPGGTINLYKAVRLEDAELFDNAHVFDVSKTILGERKIVEIKK